MGVEERWLGNWHSVGSVCNEGTSEGTSQPCCPTPHKQWPSPTIPGQARDTDILKNGVACGV